MTIPPRPQIGHPTLLVYRECPCGNWLVTGEGAMAPKCAECEGFYVPGGGPRLSPEAMYGKDHADARRIRGLGFVGFLTNEIKGAELVWKIVRLLGLADAERPRNEDGCYFERNEVQEASDEIAKAE